ncbi:cytidylyltransferase domain-containing protein [Geomonas edaphica]|uniref:cytidylyltransferase domain-containing protein n=1 Tax=Geomonas edaphica TaxID=2570226 RepID=UPI0010A8905C|nr:acylneuraminate cytidylyltransferase [Geomonas edaphica]
MNPEVLIVIPARGGSKGIPRKNLRPMCGRPLIAYSIAAAKGVGTSARVVVSTDDDEIELFSRRLGVDVLRRPAELATDKVTIDPVIVHTTEQAELQWGEHYRTVITIQPTSPLVTSHDIDQVIAMFAGDAALQTVITAVDDRHLRWREVDGAIVPDYEARVNRQQLPAVYRETGAIIACHRDMLQTGTRIGSKVKLYLMPAERSVDIDSFQDFWLCEQILSRKKIVITAIGSKETGLGHAFRAVMLASELVGYELSFVCEEDDSLARGYIEQHNYPVHSCANGTRLEAILSLEPDLVINDILDTSADYVMALKKAGVAVVNFEDLGLGAEVADLVFNALYPHQLPSDHILSGPRYFCLRDEFLYLPEGHEKEGVQRVLVTFGGVDEGNLTVRTLGVVGGELLRRGIEIDVVLGPGFSHHEELEAAVERLGSRGVHVVRATQRISDYMLAADLAITSAGRTVLELASVKVLTLAICQNQRETTHTFASSENGIINLGLRHNVEDAQILEAVCKVLDDAELRGTMRRKMAKLNLAGGKKRVIGRIAALMRRGDKGEDR